MPTGVGLELSRSAVRAVILERSGAQLRLRASQEVPCDTSQSEQLTHAMVQLRRRLPISQPVVLGVPSMSAILTTVSPLITNWRRAELAIQFELQQQVPFALDDVAWHFRWLSNGQSVGRGRISRRSPQPPVPDSVVGREALVAAVKRSLLEERLGCCRRAGLAVRTVAINPVALLNAWAWAARSDPARAAGGTTAFLHVIDDALAEWVLMAPTQFLVVPLGAPPTVASGGPPEREAFLQELAASWETLRQQSPEAPRTVCLVGSSQGMAELYGEMSAKLGVQVERFDALKAIPSGAGASGAADGSVVALGLALQALGVARLPLNLLASRQGIARTRQVQRLATVVSLVCTVLAFGFGLSGMLEIRQRRSALLESLKRQERMYQTLRPEVRSLLQRQEAIEQRRRRLEQLVTGRALLTQVLAQVAEVLPETVWLTTLESSKDGQVDGLLEGRARSFQDVTQFLDRLKGLPGVSSVKPLSTTVSTDATSGKEVVAFAVQVERSLSP